MFAMSSTHGHVHIGTSGWHYKHWRGPFYPQDLPPPKMLAWYADLRTPPDALPLAVAPPPGAINRNRSHASRS